MNQSSVKLLDAPLYSLLPHPRAIRLLRIQSGTGEEDINITLETFELDSDTQFDALSYVWGDVVPPCQIDCNGHKVQITRNLWGVLNQLRTKRFDCLLWVDAICINQRDNEEKSVQVAMMRYIYKRAANVIFWLGEQERYDAAAVGLMRTFFERYPDRHSLEQHRVKTLEELSLSSPDCGWAGWASLICRPWFERVWIVQEFLNANNSIFMSGSLEIPTELLVHCGYATGVCAAIRKAVVCHSQIAYDTTRAISRLLALGVDQLARRIEGEDSVRIFDLWCRSQQLEATDPRDRVFALLSTQTAVSMNMVDYNKDEAMVYTEIATKALSIAVPTTTWAGETFQASEPQTDRNDLQRVSRFLACKFRSTQSSQLPSWVPDWKPIGFTFVPLTRYYTGTAAFKQHYRHADVKDKILHISGNIVDEPEVTINSRPYMDQVWATRFKTNADTQTAARAMLDWICKCYEVAISMPPPSNENVRVGRFCRAMAFGVRLEETATAAEDYMRGFQTLYSKSESLAGEAHDYPSLLRDRNEQGGQGGIYESKFYELSAGRKFCVTKKRYLAWVPVDTKPTDRICFLAGCAVPFVVRPVGQRYELLGDCYREDMIQEGSLLISEEPQSFAFQ